MQRNAWVPSNGGAASGFTFYDSGNSEPPAFPFTTETSQLYNIPPPIGQFVKEYQGSLLVYGVSGAGSSFFYSNQTLTSVGQPQESYAPLNQVTLPIQNSNLNGMVEFPGSLCMWSDKQDMFRMTGLAFGQHCRCCDLAGCDDSGAALQLGMRYSVRRSFDASWSILANFQQ